ncbi:MAG: nuclear transport factor 2 family protein [Chloroflexota bacterium]
MKYSRFLIYVVLLILLSHVAVLTAQDTELTGETAHGQIAREVIETFWSSASTPQEMYMLEARAFADNFVLHTPFSETPTETINGAITMHKLDVAFKRLEEVSVTVEEVFVADETVTVIARVEATPIHLWALANGYYLPASDDPVTWQQVSIFHFNEDGLIDEEWDFIGMPEIEKFDR